MKKLNKVFLIGCICYAISSNAQSLIVGIPSADVAEPHHLEITHESQLNTWTNGNKWNSFNFACYGIGKNAEVTAVINNLNNSGSENLVSGLGLKKVFPLFKHDIWERKLTGGFNGLYSLRSGEIGFWTYGHFSFRIPKLKTRITAGANYGQDQTFGFRTQLLNGENVLIAQNLTTFIGGIEQPLTKHVSFIADWFSGTHDLAAVIPAIQIDIGKHVLIFGYKIPNNSQSGYQALILECMFSIPTFKKH